jgi:hypothetical protein
MDVAVWADVFVGFDVHLGAPILVSDVVGKRFNTDTPPRYSSTVVGYPPRVRPAGSGPAVPRRHARAGPGGRCCSPPRNQGPGSAGPEEEFPARELPGGDAPSQVVLDLRTCGCHGDNTCSARNGTCTTSFAN